MTATPPLPTPKEVELMPPPPETDPREEFNRIPAYIRDRILARLQMDTDEEAAARVGCHRQTIANTMEQYKDLIHRVIAAADERNGRPSF